VVCSKTTWNVIMSIDQEILIQNKARENKKMIPKGTFGRIPDFARS
jgi:hypothetical protein